MLELLYRALLEEEYVYMVVEYGDIPYLIPFDDVMQNDYVPEDDGTAHEGLINVFLNLEAAEDERLDLIEAYNRRPSDLKIIKLTLAGLWSLLDELGTMFLEGTGHPFRIDAVLEYGDRIVVDTIYSTQALLN